MDDGAEGVEGRRSHHAWGDAKDEAVVDFVAIERRVIVLEERLRDAVPGRDAVACVRVCAAVHRLAVVTVSAEAEVLAAEDQGEDGKRRKVQCQMWNW